LRADDIPRAHGSTVAAHGGPAREPHGTSIMRRLRLPAVLAVSVVGVVAPLAAAFSACSGDDGPPDARMTADAHAPGDGGPMPDADTADAGGPDATPDAAVPVDAAPDTPIS
jgi:hypothetical protein